MKRSYANDIPSHKWHIIPIGFVQSDSGPVIEWDTEHLRHISLYGNTSQHRFLKATNAAAQETMGIFEEDLSFEKEEVGPNPYENRNFHKEPYIIINDEWVTNITTDEKLIDMYKNKLEFVEDETPVLETEDVWYEDLWDHESVSPRNAKGHIWDEREKGRIYKVDSREQNVRAKNWKTNKNYRPHQEYQRRVAHN